jgi:cell wall-associated NlpC family hydrolase
VRWQAADGTVEHFSSTTHEENNVALRLRTRGRARGASTRSSRALLAVAVTAGLAAHASTAIADPAAADRTEGAESYLADLVGKVSDAEKEAAGAESELGGLRESVNKARVDVEHSQREAQQAQDDVMSAKDRLGRSQTDVDKAQDKLDGLARSAYTQGGDASPVAVAAGGDAASDSLDRSTYLRMAAEKQQSEVERLDRSRTEAANEESSLRDARNGADEKVAAAVDAHNTAQSAYDDVLGSVAEKTGRVQQLRAAADQARAKLEAARKAVDSVAASDPGATSFDKRRAAEAAVDKAPASTPAAPAGDSADSADSAASAPAAPQPAGTPAEQAPAVDTKVDVTTTAPAGDTGEGTTGTATSEQATTEQTTTEPATDSSADDGTESTEAAEATEPAEQAGADATAQTYEAPSSFDASDAGDDRRQSAIDGLFSAAGAAAYAGASTFLGGGDATASLSAAGQAGQQAASDAYAGLPVAGRPESGAPDESSTPGTSGGSGGNGGSGDTGNTGDTSDPDTSGSVSDKIERVIDRGMTQLGVQYAWGGGNWFGPTLGIRDGGVADSYGDYAKTGFDCSGLMMYAFYAVGIQLDHYSGYQYTAGTQVPVDQAKRGDMLFWGPGGGTHVALYLGDGKMLEAPESGSDVHVSDVRWDGIQPMATRMIE